MQTVSQRYVVCSRRKFKTRSCCRAGLWLLLLCWLLGVVPVSCQRERPLEPRTSTWAELRTVRRGVTVTPPDGEARAPYPRERLVDGARIEVAARGLAWLRTDTGALLLIRGPAVLVQRARSVQLERGRVFIDAPPGITTELATPRGPLHLAQVRASVEASETGSIEAYVLSGELRAAGGVRATPGQRLVLEQAKSPRVEPALTWEDWTGGLATTDRAPAPAPFGVGTVGARQPGSSGTARFPLAIQRLDVNVTIEGDFAITEVDQTFFNPASQRMEGVYTFRTPREATLQRFGVDRENKIAWGRIQERAAAAAQYQSNVYEGSTENPALLEWDAPGVYRARLYPIEPGQTRRVVVRYTEWLSRTGRRGERRLYVYPMAAEGAEESLPHIEELNVTVDLAKAKARRIRTGLAGARKGKRLIIRARDFVPRADLAVELFDSGSRQAMAYRAEHEPDLETLPTAEREAAREAADEESDYLLVPVRAADVPLSEGGLDLAIIVDASAATDQGSLALARAATAALLAHLGEDDRAVVWAGADRLRPVLRERTQLASLRPQDRTRILTELANLERGGATDLGRMLAEAAAALSPSRRGAVVYIGDGAPTVGELSLLTLRERLAKLPRPVRTYCLGVGSRANLAILEGLAVGGFAERISDGHGAARAALGLLESAERPAWLGARVDLGPGVERVYPRDTSTMVADQTVLVVGRLVSGKAPSTLSVVGPKGQRDLKLKLREIDDRGDLRRRWAQGRLAELFAENAGRAALVDLGSRYGIITPVTSLYVPTTRELRSEYGWDRSRRIAKRRHKLEREPEQAAAAEADDKEGGSGARAKGEEGSMGSPEKTKATNRRYAIKGPKDNPDPHIARAAALREASEFGSIGLLNQGAAGDPTAPAAPRARDSSVGADEQQSARGQMFGDALGDASGSSAKPPAGIGEGGGGSPKARPAGIGRGAGTATGQGFGSGHGRLGGAQKSGSPKLRMGQTTVTGALPPEVIQRIVRQNYGRFRMCYEQGLGKNPNLEGRVSVRFTIGRDGSVSNVANAGSDLPDSAVVQCILGAYRGLSFPQPEGGTVKVVYPVMFSPGGAGPAGAGPEPQTEASEADQPVAAGVRAAVRVSPLPRYILACSAASRLPLGERIRLWRERLEKERDVPTGVHSVYKNALRACEARSPRERHRLVSLMLDAISSISGRVQLWRLMQAELGASDVLYRGLLARIRTTQQMRELHAALGLKRMDPGKLAKLVRDADDPHELVAELRELREQWPDDFELALRLLDALEDAGELGAARVLARQLRARADIDASVRTAVGELYLRLAARSSDARQKADDAAAARRAFGEIVEFAPADPIARRRLGDLLRSHGWYVEARRQYETLAQLTPDDAAVPLLLAAAAQGQGRLEEAVRWTEKGAGAGAPDVDQGPATTARLLATTYLAWGRLEARKAHQPKQLAALVTRAKRLQSAGAKPQPAASAARVTLTWTHPDLHPTLWTNALGSMMPARAGDMTLGIAAAVVPAQGESLVEIRIEEDELGRAARLGAEAVLTVVFKELSAREKIVRMPVRFTHGGPHQLRFSLRGGEVSRG